MWVWFLLGSAVAMGVWHDQSPNRNRIVQVSLVAVVLAYVALTKHLL